MPHDLGRAPDGDDLPEVDGDYTRNELHEFAELVLDDEDGESLVRVQALDQRGERLDLGAAEPGEGLVEGDELRLRRERARDLEPAQVAVGEHLDRHAGLRAE